MLAWILRLLVAKTILQARNLLLHRVLAVTLMQTDSSLLRYLRKLFLHLLLSKAAIHVGKQV